MKSFKIFLEQRDPALYNEIKWKPTAATLALYMAGLTGLGGTLNKPEEEKKPATVIVKPNSKDIVKPNSKEKKDEKEIKISKSN